MLSSAPLQLGPCRVGGPEPVPRIAAICERPFSDAELDELYYRSGVTLLEFRTDAFPSPDEAFAYLEAFEKRGQRLRFGCIGTIRETEAIRKLSKGDRRPLFERLLAYVDCIDVEYEAQDREALLELARSRGAIAMLSTHNFEATPSRAELERMLVEWEALGADVAKLAVFARSSADLTELLDFTRSATFRQLVTIAMGPEGLLSRIAAPFFGSLWSYGYVDQPNAPGQLSAAELHEEFRRYHPAYARDFADRAG